jgi:glycosyltransferase involved in cell wall biosynthesis
MAADVNRALQDSLGGAVHAWRRLGYRRALASQRVVVPRGEVRVSYGQALSAAPGAAVRGGRVKLLHLQEAFPESPEAFNLLYLVSSAQPPFADELARWARRRGIRVVWNQDGVAYPAWAGSRAPGLNATMRAAMAHADHILYQSEFCRASAARFLGVPDAPAEVLPNCVDTSRFRPAEAPLPDTPWMLLAAGSHQHRGRVLRALEVVAALRHRGQDVRLIVAGQLDWDDAPADIERTARALGLATAVDLLPPYTQRDAPAIFRRAHVLLHLKYKDPCPTVVLEALACGLPVVGSRSGGLPELVDDETGILLDVPDAWDVLHVPAAAATADAVIRIMDDHARRRDAARARAQRHFGREAWVTRHGAIFRGLIAGG